MQRRDKYEATSNILYMTVYGKRKRGRPKLGWRDLVNEYMARKQTTTEIVEDSNLWHTCHDPILHTTKCRGIEVRVNILKRSRCTLSFVLFRRITECPIWSQGASDRQYAYNSMTHPCDIMVSIIPIATICFWVIPRQMR